MRLILEVLRIAMWNTRLAIGVFLTVNDNRWSCGRAIFHGNPASKTNKTSSPFHNNIVLKILDHQQTSNQFDMKISVHDIAFSVLPSIGDSWPVEEVTKNIFSTNSTFHSIIMMTSVALCKMNEEINYVSIFHNHVVRILLRNRRVKLVLPIDIENPYRLSNCLYRYISIYIGFLATNF